MIRVRLALRIVCATVDYGLTSKETYASEEAPAGGRAGLLCRLGAGSGRGSGRCADAGEGGECRDPADGFTGRAAGGGAGEDLYGDAADHQGRGSAEGGGRGERGDRAAGAGPGGFR